MGRERFAAFQIGLVGTIASCYCHLLRDIFPVESSSSHPVFTVCAARYSLHPPEEWSERYIFETVREKYILGNATRTVELHNIHGLAHAAGMLIAYLPKEEIVVQADLYNPQAAANASNRTSYQNLQRLKLDVTTIVGIHGNSGPMTQLVQLVNRTQSYAPAGAPAFPRRSERQRDRTNVNRLTACPPARVG
jgi:hypothetical protein